MVVTSDKYSQDTLEDLTATVAGETQHRIYTLLPLALTEYVNDSQFRQKFFLDGVWHMKDKSGKECVLGLIRADGSTNNYLHHATRRHGKLGKTIDGVNYIELNDGGLNTKPHAEFSGNILAAYTNYVKILCNLRSAYYIRTEQFTITMRWTHNSTQQEYSWPLNVGTAENPTTILGAGASLNQFVAKYKGVIGSLSAGDTITLEISATNSECTNDTDYVNPTTKSATVLGAMNFIVVYRRRLTTDHNGKGEPNWADDSIDPTDPANYDERWAMLISEDMYYYPSTVNMGEQEQTVANGGVLGVLFHMPAGDYAPNISSDEWLTGAELNDGETAEDAYDKSLSVLGDGWYFGVPKESVSDTNLTWVYINTVSAIAKRMYWHGNSYVIPNYTISLRFTGSYNRVTGLYTVSLYATATGSVRHNSHLYVEIYDEISLTPTRVPVYSIDKSFGTAGSFPITTFTTDNSSAKFMTYHTFGVPSPTNVDENGYLARNSEATVNVSDLPNE